MKNLILCFVLIFMAQQISATNHIVTNTNDSGSGSLRAKINLAQDGDVITFDPSIANNQNDTLFLDSTLIVNSSLTIIGKFNSTGSVYLSGKNLCQIMKVNLSGRNTQHLKLYNLGLIEGRFSESYYGGGAIYFKGDTLLCENVLFKNNNARSGGAIEVSSDYSGSNWDDLVSLKNSKFHNNSALGHFGGAISMYSSYKLTVLIEDCEFKYNTCPSDGGAIRAYGDQFVMKINRSKIVGNSSQNNGGGIFIQSDFGYCNTIIENSEIDSNASQKQGGGIYCMNKSDGTKIVLINSSVSHNSSSLEGGGIYNQVQSNYSPRYSQIRCENSLLSHNNSSTKGGGIYFNSSDSAALFMKNSEMNNNSARNGGAIHFYGKLYVDASKSIFNDNTASYNGGAIYVEGNTYYGTIDVFFNEVSFNKNISQWDGGAIYYDGYGRPELHIKNCELDSNIATNGRGGAVLYQSQYTTTHLNLNNSTFSNNSAKYGGALYQSALGSTNLKNHMDIYNTTFTDNKATTQAGGIYFRVSNSSSATRSFVVIKNSTFFNNEKGGIFALVNNGSIASNIEIKGSLVYSNDAENIKVDSIISGGYNAIEDSLVVGAVSTDILNVKFNQLNLSALANNGGFAKTLMPKPSSVLYNSGNPSDISNAQNWIIKGVREIGACEKVSLIQLFDTVSACTSYTSPSGNYTWNSSGDYQDKIFTSTADTLYHINLSVLLNATQTMVYPYLRSNDTGVTYKWLDCNNGYTAIPGGNSQWFTIPANGSYTVEISKNGCKDTASCISINNVGLNTFTNIDKQVKVYPNPTSGELTIVIPEGKEPAQITVLDLKGKIVYKSESNLENIVKLELMDLTPGIYLVQVTQVNKSYWSKIIKQ